MTTPQPAPKAERREINAAAGLALLTIIILGPTYLRDVTTGTAGLYRVRFVITSQTIPWLEKDRPA